MIYINIQTTKILTLKQELLIKDAVKLIIKEINSYFLIKIEDNQLIYNDYKEEDCILIEIKTDQKVNVDICDNNLKEKIEEITHISKKYIFMIYETIKIYG